LFYIALVYIVHLEAMKANMQGLPRARPPSPILARIFVWATILIAILILSIVVYYGLGWIKVLAGEHSLMVISLAIAAIYIALIWWCSKFPKLHLDDPNAPIKQLPYVKETVNSGLHFILPVVVLIWCLMVERMSPGTSAFWGTMVLIFILLTQKPLFAFFRAEASPLSHFKDGFKDLLAGLETGARNMIGIGIATAAAGVIVGVVALTNIGAPLAAVVEVVSGGNILLMLVMVGILSLILGMGLPTTANYIVVSSLLATVVVEVGRQNGLVVPLIAVHLFVFYFGIMADVTPPVGLASFAAAAVSGGNPIKTGVIAFFYSLRTAILPFLFIFNTDLLLINVTWVQGIVVFVIATVAILVFTAATQKFFFDRCNWLEVVLLLLISFTLFRPGYFMEMISPSYEQIKPTELTTRLASAPTDRDMMLEINGVNDVGDPVKFFVPLPIKGKNATERLANTGLTLRTDGDKVLIDDVAFDSAAQKAGFDWDQEIIGVKMPKTHFLPKELLFIPALIVLAFIAWMQIRRRKLNTISTTGEQQYV
ncbi:MAG: TRAP transporter permease, partial [Ostreibacterium sp.]